MSSRVLPVLLAALLAALALPAGAGAATTQIMQPTHADTPQTVNVDLAGQVRRSRLSGVRAVSPGTTQSYLPTTWCGTERTTDDTADSTVAAGQAYYKLVYAYASDQPDRFATWQDVLQADVSLIGQYMGLQDGATKSPRFDMGTSCGSGYVDIQVVRLPGTRASYADQFGTIATAVGQQLGAATGPRDVVILADGLTNNSPGYLYGLGQFWGGSNADLAGAANPHNGGGLYAAVFPTLNYNPAVSPGDQFYPGFWPEGMLHELTHTLGAVNPSAPHSTSYGHCTDGLDVMCYADGGTSAAPYSSSVCPALAGSQAGMTQTYDCGHDDYFDPSPAAGSYLATHWNVFDSAFEAPCSTIGDACGSNGASVPVSVAPPSAQGVAQVGATLSAAPGSWSGGPDSYSYQWQRTPIGGGTAVDIAGATGSSYALGATDAGHRLRVVVVAANATGASAPAPSQLSDAIAAATAPATTPATPTAPAAPRAALATTVVTLRRGHRTLLKLTVTSRRTQAGLIARIAARRVKVSRRGTYRLTLCAGVVCIAKPFRASHGKARLPAIVAATTRPGAVTLRLIGPGGRFVANVPG